MRSRLPEEHKTILRRLVKLGVDLVAVYTARKNEAKNKKIKLFKEKKTDILKQDLTTDDYLKKIEDGVYDNGYAIICGNIRRGELSGFKFCYLDIDKKEGVEAFCDYGDKKITIEELANSQYVEFNGIDRDQRIHIPYILTDIAQIAPKGADDKLGIELNTNGVMFAAPSPYHKGGFYQQMGKSSEIKILDKTMGFTLEDHIRTICEKNGVNYFPNEKVRDNKEKAKFYEAYTVHLHDDGSRIKKGGRHEVIKFICMSYFFKHTLDFSDLTDDQRFERMLGYDKIHCDPPLYETDPQEVLDLWKWTIDNNRRKRDLEREAREEEKRKAREGARQQSSGATEYKQNLLASYPQSVRQALGNNIWTQIGNNPPRFIVGEKRNNHVCRAEVKTITVGNMTLHNLSYGTIIFKCIPATITEHQNPLDFLSSQITYTITFLTQANKIFTLPKMTLNQIMEELRNYGYIMPGNGATEVLAAIITAFRDDNLIKIDKSVDFEGYYCHDGDIQVSKVNGKHTRRTKDECITCVEFLDKLSTFYEWRYKDKEIDRRDFLASAIRWTIASPFNFAIKQLTRKYQKGFDMTGERDGGKSEMSHMMLDLHGNFIDQVEESIYSLSSGSMNTEAKFGKGVSKTTYPIEISEFGRIETYGRNENMVETVKTAIEKLTVRRGRDGGRYDVLFPSLSSIILNGNPFISKKGEILKRLHIVNFSQEDRHESNDPRTNEFNDFMKSNRHKLRILGDWTINYILDNRHELLLSKKYDTSQIGDIVLKKFYEFVDLPFPEWMTRWITETSLEELDIDEESTIRSILFDHVHKTLQNNAKILVIEDLGKINLDKRIGLCLKYDLWSFVRKLPSQDKYHIDSSILHVFDNKLPDLTLKKLGEKMGSSYKTYKERRVLEFSEKELMDFIVDEHGEEYCRT